MMHSPLHFFIDPLLRGPTIGCMLMCLVAALVGVIAFLRKQSLLGETLSHAAYPGVILGVIVAGAFTLTENQEGMVSILVLAGAFCTAILGIVMMHLMEKKLHVHSDTALCFVLSSFFGIGITLASDVQFTNASLYRQVQTYLYGQAATMTDLHIWVYGIFALVLLCIIFLFYKEIQVSIFNRDYAKSLGINVRLLESILFIFIVLAIVLGIRSVGVVLMSAMLISPVVSARQFTHKLSSLFVLAGCFGVLSGFLGNYFSVELDHYFSEVYPGARLILPTGPMIVLIASLICLCSLCFSTQQGLVVRLWRNMLQRNQSLKENILKVIFLDTNQSFSQLKSLQPISSAYLYFLLRQLKSNGYLIRAAENSYQLTPAGVVRATKILHVHEKWGRYLAENNQKVNKQLSLEEMDAVCNKCD